MLEALLDAGAVLGCCTLAARWMAPAPLTWLESMCVATAVLSLLAAGADLVLGEPIWLNAGKAWAFAWMIGSGPWVEEG